MVIQKPNAISRAAEDQNNQEIRGSTDFTDEQTKNDAHETTSPRLFPCPVGKGQTRVIVLKEVLHRLQVFGRSLESFDLLAQLRLLGLFGAKYFVDIFHRKPPTKNLLLLSAVSNVGWRFLITSVSL